MREDFLHYLWKFKKFDFLHASTTDGESLLLVETGLHNQHEAGPDFFNAKLRIGDQLWAGNVEIHLKSGDWYLHNHHLDPLYDNVILHVVWEHDMEVFRKDNSKIPCLILKGLVYKDALANYQKLLQHKKHYWINCEPDFSSFPQFMVANWLDRLYVERLEEKSEMIRALLEVTTNDWEAVLFLLLSKNFGLNVNGEAFLSMVRSFPFSVVRKLNTPFQLEALFYGQFGMLEDNLEEPYHKELKQEYDFLVHKFRLNREAVLPVNFFRLRPNNFPTIRLSQLANLYGLRKDLFMLLVEQNDLQKIYEIFRVETSEFWRTHYSFEKRSANRMKRITKEFVDLILINTVVPLKFSYFTQRGDSKLDDLFQLMHQLPKENNGIIQKFNKLRPGSAENALHSQALLHLKRNYCDKNKCLQCQLGVYLLNKQPTNNA